MKILVLGATGGTGQLIGRFHAGERQFLAAVVRSQPSMQHVDFICVHEPTIAKQFNSFEPQERILFI